MRALQATLTVKIRQASADTAGEQDSEEADPLAGLCISAVALEDYRACMEQVQASLGTCRAHTGRGEVKEESEVGRG